MFILNNSNRFKVSAINLIRYVIEIHYTFFLRYKIIRLSLFCVLPKTINMFYNYTYVFKHVK